MNKITEVKWKEVARRGDPHPVLFIDSVFELYMQGYFADAHNTDWNPEYYRQLDGARWLSNQDIQKYTKFIQDSADRRENTLSDFGIEYEKRLNNFREFADQCDGVDFEKLDKTKLLGIFEQYWEHTKQMWSFAYDYIFINKTLPDKVTHAVAKKVSDVMKQNKYLVDLFESDRSTEMREEKKSLVDIAESMRDRSPEFSDVESDIEDHLDKFAHLGLYYFSGAAYTKDDIKERLQKYLDMDLAEFKQLKKEILEQENNQNKTQKIIFKLDLDKKYNNYVKYIKIWAWLSNYADETYAYVVHNLWDFWHEVAARLDISFEQLLSLQGKEVIDALRKGALSQDLKMESEKRLDDNVILLEKGEKRILTGIKLDEYKAKHKKKEKHYEQMDELKGQSASPGKVVGKVKIVMSVNDVTKVEKGDILVSVATNPTYVPAMERAGAVVTDEGGLLSHAAIVSRELKIPCVVGTKYGTKIFKDGDMVEVDAERGAVTKIEKQEKH